MTGTSKKMKKWLNDVEVYAMSVVFAIVVWEDFRFTVEEKKQNDSNWNVQWRITVVWSKRKIISRHIFYLDIA